MRDGTFWIPATNWSFTLGTNAVGGVHAAACGVLSFGDPVGLARPAPLPDAFEAGALLAPLWGELDLVPPRSRFSRAVTADGGLLLTWERLAAGGDTNAAVSLQAELFPNGDFVWRYAVPSNAAPAVAAALTNFVIGAQHNGGGETWAFGDPSRLADGLELRWRAFGLLDPEVADHDGDGVATADEILVCRTDPRNADTDGDGLWDGEEVSVHGTDPLVWDSVSPGTNDFWHVFPPASLTNAPQAEAGAGQCQVTITSRLEYAASGVAALRFGEWVVPVLPGTTLVSRLALPLNTPVLFAYVPGPGLPAGAAPRLSFAATAIQAEVEDAVAVVFSLLDDPHGVFAAPAPPPSGPAPLATPLSAPPGSVKAVPGESTFVGCFISPGNLCAHAGMTVRAAQVPPEYTLYFIKNSDTNEPPLPYTVLPVELSEVFDPIPDTPGLHRGQIDFRVGLVKGLSSQTVWGTPLPVHYCVFPSAVSEPNHWICTCGPDDPCGPECPCGHTGAFCPCCCGDPWAVPYSETNNAAVETRPGKTLLVGGASDSLPVAIPAPGSPASRVCPLCGCKDQSAPVPQAFSWLRTPGIAVSPSALAASGVFRVDGTRPSTNFGSEVFTYTVNGRRYSRGRYTVAGVSNYLAAAGGPVAAPPYPRIACGVTNALVLWTGVQLPAGAVTLSLAGSGGAALLVRNRLTGELDTLVSGTNDTFSCTIAAWHGKYVHPETRRAEAVLVGGTPGTCTLTHRYDHDGANEYDVHAAAAQTFQVCRLVKEDVTTENFPNIYNPSVIPQGDTGQYKVSLEPEDLFAETNIVWSIKSGGNRVSFVGGNMGRTVTVKGNETYSGEFELEISASGVDLNPPATCKGWVAPLMTVGVTAWAVSDGTTPAATTAAVTALIGDANPILRRTFATTLQWDGTLHVTNRADWLNIALTNGVSPAADAITDIVQGTGGIELYFVNSITDTLGGHAVGGYNTLKGMILTSSFNARILAHELGHVLGLRDIYTESEDGTLFLDGPATEARLPDDWGGGYYPPGLVHEDVVRRLLMFGIDDISMPVPGTDLPYNSVYGVWYKWEVSSTNQYKHWFKSLAPIGWNNIGQLPVHQ